MTKVQSASLLSPPFKNPLVVALDVDNEKDALELADRLSEVVGGFKLGPRLCLRYGEGLTRAVAELAPVFLDNKHFDIPSTMTAAVRASFDAGASAVTVHAQAGEEALRELANIEKELNQVRPFRIFCVSILTSFSESTLPSVLKPQKIADHVGELAHLVKKCGLTSLVCSPHEISLLRQSFTKEDLFLLTPGIRFDLEDKQDQKRTMGPKEAMKLGASALVVGRPILAAKNPLEEATDYLSAILQL